MGTAFMLVIFMVGMMDFTEGKAGLIIAVLPAAALVLAPVGGRHRRPGRTALAGGDRRPAQRRRPVRPRAPDAHRARARRAVARGARRRRPRPVAAGAHRRRHERRARRRERRRLRHAQHGPPARLPPRRRDPRRRLRPHHARRGEPLGRPRPDPHESPGRPLAPTCAPRSSRPSTPAAASTPPPASARSARSRTRWREVIAPRVGPLEAFALLGLKDRLEAIFWDEVSAAFRWPFYTAALAAVLGALAGALLPRRPPPEPASPA